MSNNFAVYSLKRDLHADSLSETIWSLVYCTIKYNKYNSHFACKRMTSRSLILLCVLCYCFTVSTARRMKVEGKEFDVLPYPGDCTKYLVCRKGVCNLGSCMSTYVFDPAAGTCSHQARGFVDCGLRSPKKYSPSWWNSKAVKSVEQKIRNVSTEETAT